jgi:photosystem II stability/assembly factor-like uncharacterized protein
MVTELERVAWEPKPKPGRNQPDLLLWRGRFPVQVNGRTYAIHCYRFDARDNERQAFVNMLFLHPDYYLRGAAILLGKKYRAWLDDVGTTGDFRSRLEKPFLPPRLILDLDGNGAPTSAKMVQGKLQRSDIGVNLNDSFEHHGRRFGFCRSGVEATDFRLLDLGLARPTADGIERDYEWKEITPRRPYSGFCSLAINPLDRNHLLAALRQGGIYQSNDGGVSWKLSNTGTVIENLKPNGVAVNQFYWNAKRPSLLLAGLEWNGPHLSTDAGATWAPLVRGLRPGGGMSAVTFEVAPDNPQIIYHGSDNGFYRSEDGGKSWKFNEQFPIQTVHDLAAHPRDKGVVFAAVYVAKPGAEAGIWVSRDYGVTWKPCNNGLPQGEKVLARINAKIIYGPQNRAGFRLHIDPTDPDVMFAATGSGVFVSRDGGEEWRLLQGLPASSNAYDFAASPTHPEILYAGFYGGGVFRSRDRGETWQIIPGSEKLGGPIELVVDPLDPYMVYASSGVGIHCYTMKGTATAHN